MKSATIRLRVKGKDHEISVMLPETAKEVLLLPEKQVLEAMAMYQKHLARLSAMRDGRPPRQKKKLILDIEKLDPQARTALIKAGLL